MLKLKFNLRHQDIQLVNKGVVVATDSKDYLVAKFNTVSDDWEAPLTAIFTDDKHKQPYAVIVGADERLVEDECFVPWEVLTDAANVYVSVYCGNLHTTVTAVFKVRKSGYIEGETPPPPSPTVYDIIMQAITDLQVGKQDKLTAGENITIDENDGTISAEGGVTSYVDLDNKPQINGHELVGNKTGDDLGLQNKLTAGENVTIDANGEISATGGTDDYEELDNLPLIVGFYGFQNSKNNEVVKEYERAHLKGWLSFAEEDFKVCHFKSPPNAYEHFLITLSENVFFSRMNVTGFGPYNFKKLYSKNQNRTGIIPINRSTVQNLPPELEIFDGNFFITHYFQMLDPVNNIESLPFIRYASGKDSNGEFVVFAQIATAQFDMLNWSDVKNESNWVRMSNVTISSTTVNQNGTITFTMSDGSTVTTTGESVIGPQGPAGADGNDYVLTAQDKTDIANIVLSELPTTQGVQYGNSND